MEPTDRLPYIGAFFMTFPLFLGFLCLFRGILEPKRGDLRVLDTVNLGALPLEECPDVRLSIGGGRKLWDPARDDFRIAVVSLYARKIFEPFLGL